MDIRLENPTMNAAGTLGISQSLLSKIYKSGAGAVVTKSLGPKPRMGHQNPTLVSLECGVLNAMGLPNPGAENFFKDIKALTNKGVPTVASFFGSSINEFRDVATILSESGAIALELNCSCPNVLEEMGMLGADPINTEKVTRAVKEVSKLPVIVKLSPNVTDITEIAMSAVRGGADAITATNTLKGIAINTNFFKPVLKNITGGLSGPALKPVALRCVWEIFQTVDVPIIGCGGISNWRDAIEYFLCGATAVQIGTAIKENGFDIFNEIINGIRKYLKNNGFSDINDIVGLAHE